jgi:hypothetical protein
MRRADIVPKRKVSLADVGVLAVCQGYCGVALILTESGGLFALFGVAMFLCGGLIGFLMFLRALKLDLKALDNPNDNPRANRLIANRRERGSFDAQTALLGALFVLMFALAAYLHERWTVVAYIAAVIFVISALLLVRRALKLIRSLSI